MSEGKSCLWVVVSLLASVLGGWLEDATGMPAPVFTVVLEALVQAAAWYSSP